MKRFMGAVLAVAMCVAFIPIAEAGDTASLQLKVSFDKPLKIWTEPEGPFEVIEGESLAFSVTAEDQDAEYIQLEAVTLPEGAKFMLGPDQVVTATSVRGFMTWKPEYGQGNPGNPYTASFVARSSNGDEAEISVSIYVHIAEISVELSGLPWELTGIKFGERRKNISEAGEPLHMIKNIGNIPIRLRVEYGPTPTNSIIRPDIEQGVDRYVTWVSGKPLSLDRGVTIPLEGINGLDPGATVVLQLEYGAPLDITQDAPYMFSEYVVIAYPGGYDFDAPITGPIVGEPIPLQ